MQSSQQSSLFDHHNDKKQGPVECLGMTFENDEARRAYFTDRLREKLQDPEFRKIEGFPIGENEDILRLSDPPYYTACPNPFLAEVLAEWQAERLAIHARLGLSESNEQHEPYAADISEGKNDPIYNAHSYHTKVPHKAIMRYILHYTEPGDIVYDGFCGSGMTGVATQLCGDRKAVEELGYRVDENGTIWEDGKAISILGTRKAVLNDLSPAATFIAYNYNTSIDPVTFKHEAKRILNEIDKEYSWMYETWHPNFTAHNREKGQINFTIWSDVFVCPNCGMEMAFWDVAVDKDQEARTISDDWNCPGCATVLAKRPQKESGALRVERAWETRFDHELKQTIRQSKQVPVMINYSVGKNRYDKRPDASDLDLIHNIEEIEINYSIPLDRMPEGSESRRNDDIGLSHVHHYYTRRSLLFISILAKKINQIKDSRLQKSLFFMMQSLALGYTKLNRYGATHYSQVNRILSGTLYVSSLIAEVSPEYAFTGKANRLTSAFSQMGKINGQSAISTNSSIRGLFLNDTLDYIFVDPPFGGNLSYSELSFLWESWLKVITNNESEAIINKELKKGLVEYQSLILACFIMFYWTLKPGHWMTVEFHNSQNSVWIAIQEALQQARFIIADVRVLDKQQGTFKQVTTSAAVKQDLIISAYKPNYNLEKRTRLTAGTEESAWEFIHYHLGKLPIINVINGILIVNQERQIFLLFDRMVAFHVQRGILVPMSSAEFYAGLVQRFPERDGMYFLPDQVGKYDQARLQAHQVEQLQLFVNDESSAILWLRQHLGANPQTYQDLFPKFIREISAWEKQEKALELYEILEQNFLSYDGAGPIPEQIWSWMQKDEDTHAAVNGQNRENPSNPLRTVAKGRWFVPDPNNAQQLEKVREKALLKEFNSYKECSGKKLKVFRLEAVRAGFKKAWQDRDYKTIIAVAEKISEEVFQQDSKLLMWYDQALTRMEQ